MITSTDSCLDLLFETSWEVCNKVGGIYAVLSTKARTLQAAYKDRVIFVGPDVWTADTPCPYFTEVALLLKSWRTKADLPHGLSVRVGRWNVPGRPIAVLVNFQSMYQANAELYGRMWQLYGVDSLHAYGDYDEACAFSHAAALVIESIKRCLAPQSSRCVAHFNEWTTGMGLLHVKAEMPEVATVFTTHATSIGRSICGNGKELYAYFQGYNGDQMAAELNMQSKHSLEKAAAHQADCFTTVSEVTARECEQLLEIRPLVTPNGFEPDFVPSAKAMPAARRKAREAMLRVASALTGVEYDDDTFIVATSGRCEYRNKGLDVWLDACSQLRSDGAAPQSRRVLAFVMVPAWQRCPRHDLLCALEAGERTPLPHPVITHELHNPESDPIIGGIDRLGFRNAPADRVHMIYVPCYLDGSDGLFGGLTYYDLLPGLDATVFASYYEPWGYTPLEAVAFGVPTITTSLSGFGQWALDTYGSPEASWADGAVHVARRDDGNYPTVVSEIAARLSQMLTLGPAQTARLRANASATASRATWQHFIPFYYEAFAQALSRKNQTKTK